MDLMPVEKRDGAADEQAVALAASSTWLPQTAALDYDLVLVTFFAVAACAIHFLWNGGYGYFRDELYYMACGEHLAWGYVDQAPLIAVIARITQALLGNSLRALRFFPALSSGAKIFVTAYIVRELGGNRFAQILAGTAMLFCPIYLTMDNFFSMNAFEPVFWMLCVAIALRIVRSADQRLWLWFGVVTGMGILNKHSTLIFGLAFGLSLIVTRRWELLRSRWIWLGGLISFLIFLPNLVWEIQNHWPTIEILRNVDRIKNVHVGVFEFMLQQAFLVHPLGAPICISGLWFYLASRRGAPFRFLGWTYCFLLAEFLLVRGRIYYVAPIYPMLFAAGAVAIEGWIGEHDRPWVRTAILAPLVIGGIVAAPLALPILPLDAAASYAKFWDVDSVQVERVPVGKLPQLFGDMMGWPEQAQTVARVFRTLSTADQSRAAILTENYGQAGAIDRFGAALGLPHAISGHNSYYLWGPGQYTGEVVIAVGMPLNVLQSLFGTVELAATIHDEYAIPEENNLPVYICRSPKMSLQQAWPRLKFYG